MRLLLLGALPWALMAQTPPITFQDLQARARTAAGEYRTQALLAEGRRGLAASRGLLREGPSLAVSAGPRRPSDAPSSTDQTVDLDLPLFLDLGARRRFETALGQADPLLRQGAALEARLGLRRTYLEAWMAEQALALREADLATVRSWLGAAKARVDVGADPAFQASLVEGEILKAQLDLEEARRTRLQAWAALAAFAELPADPVPLEHPGPPDTVDAGDLAARFPQGTLRRSLQARLELEEQSLRHQEAFAASRWSLRASHAKEEPGVTVSKVGVAYRFARPGEDRALRQETEANLQALRRDLELARLELEARFRAALQGLQSFSPGSAPDFPAALRAIGLRLAEGKERPSEALPIRRQLLEAQVAQVRRLQAAHLHSAELQALTAGAHP